jgi:hypothetical protein
VPDESLAREWPELSIANDSSGHFSNANLDGVNPANLRLQPELRRTGPEPGKHELCGYVPLIGQRMKQPHRRSIGVLNRSCHCRAERAREERHRQREF